MTLARVIGACCAIMLLLFTSVGRAGVNVWTPTGPSGGWVYGLAWHPSRAGVMFAAVNGRIYRSTNSGQQWASASGISPVSGSFVFDPTNADRILVSGQPVLRSTDGGATFLPVAHVPGFHPVTRLAITASGAAVYSAASGKVFRTTDFGGSWTEVSSGLPGGIGDLATGLRVSPSSANTLYVSFQGTGLYKSTDAGASWTLLTSLAGPINGLAINPNNSVQLLASTSTTLWRSNDGGASWTSVMFGTFLWFDYDPAVPNRVLAYDYPNRRLIVSTDAGGLWLPAGSVPSVQGYAGAFSQTTSGAFAFGTTEGVFVSDDAGQSLAFRSTGLRGAAVRTLATSKAAPFRIYGSFYGGPDGVHLQSADSWQPLSVAPMFAALGERTVVEALAVDPNNSSIVYAGSYGGLVRSTNAGITWTLLKSNAGDFIPSAIVVDPSNSQVVYLASATLGFMRSTNGGINWIARNNGLPVNVPIIKVFIDPADTQKLYVVDQPQGSLYRTTDAGLNWAKVAGGLPGNEVAYTVAFDSLDANRVYAGTQSGLYRSQDAGATWSPMSLPIGLRAIFSVLVNPVAPGTLMLVSASLVGVVRSVDYGASWESLPYPADQGDTPLQGILDPAQDGMLHVGSYQDGMRKFQVAPDLSLSLSGVASVLPLGGTPTLRMLVQNKVTSPYSASDVAVSLVLPSALVPGTITATRGSCTRNGQSIACRLGGMNVGSVAQIDIALTVIAGAGSVSAMVTALEADLALADNGATTAVSVQPISDLSVALTAPATVNQGGPVALQGRITNIGPNTAENSRLIFTVPAGLTAVSTTGTSSSCTIGAGTVTCSAGALALNASASFDLQATASTVGSQSIVVNASSDNFDPDTANNAATQATSVNALSSGGGGSGGSGSGGGGAMDLWELVGLLTLMAVNVSRRCRLSPRPATQRFSGFGLSAVKRFGFPSL